MRLRNLSAGVAIGSLLLLASSPAPAQQPLKTAVDGTFAPHAMPKLSGGIEGFNVDLANEIGRRLKRPVEIAATQFSGILPSLQAGTIAGMHERWFGIKPPAGSAAVTIFPGTGVPGMPGYDPTPREPKCD